MMSTKIAPAPLWAPGQSVLLLPIAQKFDSAINRMR